MPKDGDGSRARTSLRSILVPVPPPGRAARLVTLALFFVGSTTASAFLSSLLPAVIVPVVGALVTGAYAARWLVHGATSWRRIAGWLAWIVVALLHAFWLYLAVAWGTVLAWSVGAAAVALVAALIVGALWTSPPSWRRSRVPWALPIGVWIAACLLGWRDEESLLRCDDLATVRAQPAVHVLVPTTVEQRACAPGGVVHIGRYPRVVWPMPDGQRLIVTTQDRGGVRGASRFHGVVCEVDPGNGEPRCIRDGKAQGIVDAPALDRIFVGNWGRFPGGRRGRLLAFRRTGPLALVSERTYRESFGDMAYEPLDDAFYGFTDEGGEILRMRASDGEILGRVPVAMAPPGMVRYDPARHEGILCGGGGPFLSVGGRSYMALAIRGHPFGVRPLGDGVLAPLSISWGCDWDPTTRRAYLAIPNLGVLATVDYDSGAVLAVHPLGFGARCVTLDHVRHRLYVSHFPDGYVSAVDPTSGTELARWFVGRYPRIMNLSTDGRSLLLGSNLGVVAIDLGR